MTVDNAKDGSPKIAERVSLPITAPECVGRVITDIAVIDVASTGFELVEAVEGWVPEDVQE